MEKEKFIFSIIIPVYNSEKWIEETIKSITNQSIGMENIQIIIVDDGSKDNSLKICEKFRMKYPYNIELISKKNEGVAIARNTAIEHIKGRYVEFVDSDDTISHCTLEMVYKFFEENKEKIDIVSIPMIYFDGRVGPHYLNERFDKGTRIIDLNEEPQKIMVHITPNFIKREIISKYRFDEKLATCEDSKLLIQLLLENSKYGALSGCTYNYRLRSDEKSSLSQTAKKDKRWYTDQIINYPLWIIWYCQKEIGYVPNFVKYILASHLQWRFKKDITQVDILSKEENHKYQNLLRLSVKYIDDYIIDDMSQLSEERKKYMKDYKYGKEKNEVEI